MIFYAIVGLLFIALCVFAYQSASDWHWVNLVFLLLTYLAAVAAMLGLTQLFAERNKVMKSAESARLRMIDKEAQAAIATYGAPDSIEYSPDSLLGADEKLKLALMGRGRVWSGGVVTAEGDVRTFTFPSERPEIEDPTQSLGDVELFAFREGKLEESTYPVSFIGKVRVTAEDTKSLKLEPVFLADGKEFVTPTGSWALFEKMPIDRRESFREVEGIALEDLDISDFRERLKTKYLSPQLVNLPADSEAYERLLDRFTFDGVSIGKIDNWVESQPNRKSPRFEPLPEEVMVKFQFNKASSKAYPVDVTGGNLDTDGPFTRLGLAVDPTLHAGKDIQFAADDTITVDQLTADGYQRADGTRIPPFSETEDVTEIDRVFRRQLSDYPYLMAQLQRQTIDMVRETQRVKQNNAVQEQTLVNTQSQIQDRARVTEAVEQDNENLAKDLESIITLEERREQEVAQYRKQLETIEQQVNAARRQLQAQASAIMGL